jgi:5S rRNA maturation endonuclease (ribonuclease M5)
MITQILESRGFQLKRKTDKEYSSPCPFCGGEDRFCVWPEVNRYWCRQCRMTGDDIQLLQDLENMSFAEAKEAVGRSEPCVQGTKRKPTKKLKKSVKPFVHPELGKPDEIYDYTDKNGKAFFHVCRWGRGKEKTFRQCKPDGLTWSIKGLPFVLYNLPEINNQNHVAFVEGEQDVHALTRLGFPSTTSPMGAGKNLREWQDKYKLFDALKDKTVYIFPDNDKAGQRHAEEVASVLMGIAKTIKLVRLIDLPESGDISDFIKKEGDKATAKLTELIASTPVWTPLKAFYSLQDLYDLPTEDHIPIIDAGIMPYNSHILIAGESGVGKSLLRLELAIHLAMGWDWMGFHIPRARSVAIFQYENSEHTERFRVKKMLDGLGVNITAIGDRIKYAKRDERYNLTQKGDRAKLLQRVKDLGCEVIIYDCLTNLHNANENDNVKMREVLDILTDINAELKTSCIVIHHFGKPGENPDNRYRIRGASSINDWAYTVITFERKPHKDKTIRKIDFTKVRAGKEPRPFLVERNSETFLLDFYDEESLVPPAAVAQILGDKFNGFVDVQKLLVEAIIEEKGCVKKTAKVAIKKAQEMKTICPIEGKNKRTKGYRLPMSGQL